MTTDDLARSRVLDRPCDLPTLDAVVAPRWLRERRRAERLAARPEAFAAELARHFRYLTSAGRERTFRELMEEQGIKPFNYEEWRTREPLLSHEDWAELRAAMGLDR